MSEEVKEGDIAADLMNLTAPPAEEPSAPEPEPDSDPVEEPQQDNTEAEEQPEEDLEATVDDDADEDIEVEAEEPDEAEEEQTTDDTPEEVMLPDGGKVNKEELISGYMRQADYTRKTAELAEQRKKSEQQLQEQNAQIAQVLEALQQRYHAFDPRAPYMQALQEAQADGDTERATQLQGHIQHLTAEIERFEKANQYEQEQKQGKEQESLQQRQAHEREALLEKMPELKDKKKVQEFQQNTNKALKRFGYSDDEIASMKSPDHRDAMAYYYAEKYFQSLDKAPKAAEKLKGKAVTPKSRPRKTGQDNAKNSALANFNKNPNAEGSLAGVLQSYGI